MTLFLFGPHLGLQIGKFKSKCTRTYSAISTWKCTEAIYCCCKRMHTQYAMLGGDYTIMDRQAQQTHLSLPIIEDSRKDHWANYHISCKEWKDYNTDECPKFMHTFKFHLWLCQHVSACSQHTYHLWSDFKFQAKKRKQYTEIQKGKVVNHWWHFSMRRSMINVIAGTFLEIEVNYITTATAFCQKSPNSSGHYASMWLWWLISIFPKLLLRKFDIDTRCQRERWQPSSSLSISIAVSCSTYVNQW